MLQRHSLKDVAPALHKVPGCLLHGISSQCADCRLLSSSLLFQRGPTFPHTHRFQTLERSPWPHEVTLTTSNSTSVQKTIIVSSHKITKEPPGVSWDAK